ncbi:hypothetical protein [Saccharibacillus kuerlensis]|uniref:Uncharacterized protein n=1 Tax=Saccharibacillus kuerlensis TaxID=459527 RepID=A0ABQ2LBR6_9BACL|nr:hypothetical protein [Saccharibacillus kuerlensis]GGO09423.1 hypothetical protein GCM10010969_39830 [Saccharibacillus kuerlensis]
MESDAAVFERIIHKESAQTPYVALKQKIFIVLPDSSSTSYKIQDLILNEDGTSKYEDSVPYPLQAQVRDGIVSFTIPPHSLASYSSDATDYEPGGLIRGFKLMSEENDEVFAFVVRTDAK